MHKFGFYCDCDGWRCFAVAVAPFTSVLCDMIGDNLWALMWTRYMCSKFTMHTGRHLEVNISSRSNSPPNNNGISQIQIIIINSS